MHLKRKNNAVPNFGRIGTWEDREINLEWWTGPDRAGLAPVVSKTPWTKSVQASEPGGVRRYDQGALGGLWGVVHQCLDVFRAGSRTWFGDADSNRSADTVRRAWVAGSDRGRQTRSTGGGMALDLEALDSPGRPDFAGKVAKNRL